MTLTQAQLESIQEKKQKFASIMKHIKECWPDAQPEILIAEDTKFGIVDKFLFEKSKPDKNGIHSNSKIVQHISSLYIGKGNFLIQSFVGYLATH